MKKFLIIVTLLLISMSVTVQAQAQSCDDAANQALPQLAGAKVLLQSNNMQGALILVQLAEDMLRSCTTAPTSSTGSARPTDAPNSPQLLQGGIGLTTGQPINNGMFEVEGYCSYLSGNFAASTDGVNWFCASNDANGVMLTQTNFDEICRLTYSNPNAFAVQSTATNSPAYNWLCYEQAIQTAPPIRPGDVTVPELLQNGTGLTTSQPVNNGVFEVEGYCRYLNGNYGVSTDRNNWYCTQNGANVVTLTQANYDEICRLTYSNNGAYAILSDATSTPAYNWRCYEDKVIATPKPELLQNGTGLTTSRPVGNGEFEVEGYCGYLSSNYITTEDGQNWYCTLNGQTAFNLIQADFDEICRLTYNNPEAYAMQSGESSTPAYNWRCYENTLIGLRR